MPDAKIISLFGDPPPKQEDTAFWKWGEEFVGGGYLNLEAIVEDIADCENEEALRQVLTELKDEVDKIPL